MPKDNLAQVLDNTVALLTDPQVSFARKRSELQLIYESLVESRRGRTRHSPYTQIGEMARQGDVNALSFLEFVARHIRRFDRNSTLESRDEQLAAKFGIRHGESLNFPLAQRLESQYNDEFGKIGHLGALQTDALWNEILLYAKMGFEGVKKIASERIRAEYHTPLIHEAPRTDFLLPSLVSNGAQLIKLNAEDVSCLENGRKSVEPTGRLSPSYAAYLIRAAASIMQQIANSYGVDISERIEGANDFIKKLNGFEFIHTFEKYTKGEMAQAASEGMALEVFFKLNTVAEGASEHGVPLELLLTNSRTDDLKRQAVNNPKKGLRGELVEIMEGVLTGSPWKRTYLSDTDKLVPLCEDRELVAAYYMIKSAIEEMANQAYRKRASKPRELAQVPNIAVDAVSEASLKSLVASIPVNPRVSESMRQNEVRLTGDAARNILSMFADGDYEGIVNYMQKSNKMSYNEPISQSSENNRNYRRIAALSGLAAGIAALAILFNQGKSLQTPDANASTRPVKSAIEVDCSLSNKGGEYFQGKMTDYGHVEDLLVKCKPGTEPPVPREDIHLRAERSSIHNHNRSYKVVEGDTLSHIIWKVKGIKDGHRAYLASLDYGRLHDINPNRIFPGDEIFVLDHMPIKPK